MKSELKPPLGAEFTGKDKKHIRPASAKAKGRRLQQWVRDTILRLWPSLEPDDVRSTAMGSGGEDIQLSPAARKRMPVSIECKANKSFAVYRAYEQAAGNAPKGTEPVVILKADRKKPLALMSAEYFFKRMVGK